MPGGDGTGPWGTFRNCVPQGQMYGRGRGFGRGRFWQARQNMQTAAATPNAEPQVSAQQAPVQQVDRISQLESRMNELSSELKEITALLSRE